MVSLARPPPGSLWTRGKRLLGETAWDCAAADAYGTYSPRPRVLFCARASLTSRPYRATPPRARAKDPTAATTQGGARRPREQRTVKSKKYNEFRFCAVVAVHNHSFPQVCFPQVQRVLFFQNPKMTPSGPGGLQTWGTLFAFQITSVSESRHYCWGFCLWKMWASAQPR